MPEKTEWYMTFQIDPRGGTVSPVSYDVDRCVFDQTPPSIGPQLTTFVCYIINPNLPMTAQINFGASPAAYIKIQNWTYYSTQPPLIQISNPTSSFYEVYHYWVDHPSGPYVIHASVGTVR